MNYILLVRAALVSLALFAVSGQAMATSTMLSFYNITHNNAAAADAGEDGLAVEVIDLGGGQVRFLFTNNSSSALTDVYFDDGTLLGIASISDSGSGVSFSRGAAPPNLPGANLVSPGFVVTQDFLADSSNPVTKNGVSQGEWLAIDFTLINGKTYADTINALMLPGGGDSLDANGNPVDDLRIGVHVQGFSGGYSESFINTAYQPIAAVPEADTSVLLLAGLGMFGLMARRRFSD